MSPLLGSAGEQEVEDSPRSLACFSPTLSNSGGFGRVSCSFLESRHSQQLLVALSRGVGVGGSAGLAHGDPSSPWGDTELV